MFLKFDALTFFITWILSELTEKYQYASGGKGGKERDELNMVETTSIRNIARQFYVRMGSVSYF